MLIATRWFAFPLGLLVFVLQMVSFTNTPVPPPLGVSASVTSVPRNSSPVPATQTRTQTAPKPSGVSSVSPAPPAATLGSTRTPTRAPSALPATTTPTVTLYLQPDQLWSLRFPTTQFRTETLGDSLVLFRRVDQSAWLAVDSFLVQGNEYGNTGEGLRNRARASVTRILGSAPRNTLPLEPKDYPWETGIAFTTADGASGEAFYMQPNRESGERRVYGILLAVKGNAPASVRPLLEALRHSFLRIAVQSLKVASGTQPLWVWSSYGMRSHDPTLAARHFVAIASRQTTWQEIARLDLANADYLDPQSVRQVQLEPSRLWLTAESGVGAPSGCFEVFSFDGRRLRSEAASCNSSPGSSFVRNLGVDGNQQVVLDASEYYVSCFACAVRWVNYTVLRWDGSQLVEVKLTPLPDSAPTELRRLTNRAVELARGELWQEAQTTIDQALRINSKEPTVAWDAALIHLHAQARAQQAASGDYPILDYLFNGDYSAVLSALRPYAPGALFNLTSPLVVGTSTENFEVQLTDWITRTTTLQLQAKPDLAAAYFVRGWGLYQSQPAHPQVMADVNRAAQLDPNERLFTSSAAYLKANPFPPLAQRERIQFAAGAAATVLNLVLTADTPRVFVLRAQAQQTISITPASAINLALLGPQDTRLATWANGKTARLEVVATQTGDYTIVVRGQGNVRLTIAIPPK